MQKLETISGQIVTKKSSAGTISSSQQCYCVHTAPKSSRLAIVAMPEPSDGKILSSCAKYVTPVAYLWFVWSCRASAFFLPAFNKEFQSSSVAQLVCGLLTGMFSSNPCQCDYRDSGFDSQSAHTLCNSTDW